MLLLDDDVRINLVNLNTVSEICLVVDYHLVLVVRRLSMLVVLHLYVLGFREVRALRVLKLLIRLSQMILRDMVIHGAVRSISLYWFRALRIREARWRWDCFTASLVLLVHDLSFTPSTLS